MHYFKILAFLLVLPVLANGLLSECAAIDREAHPSADPWRVGVILPLSGELASIGSAVRASMMMAYDELDPQTRDRLELTFEDSQFSPAAAVTAFHKLKTHDKAQIVLTVSSKLGNALAPLAEAAGIILIAIGASDEEVVRGRECVFSHWVTPAEEAKLVVAEAKRRGYKRIARIGTIDSGLLALRTAFDQRNRGDIAIVLDQEFPPSDRDFKTYLARLNASPNIDAVLVLLQPGQLGEFARQARQSGSKLPFFGFEIFESPDEIKAAGTALEGAWYVNVTAPSEKFLQRFKEMHPTSGTFGIESTYDTLLLLAQAVRNATTTKEICSNLKSVRDFEGVMGRYSATGDNRFNIPAMLKQIRSGKFERLEVSAQ